MNHLDLFLCDRPVSVRGPILSNTVSRLVEVLGQKIWWYGPLASKRTQGLRPEGRSEARRADGGGEVLGDGAASP